MREQWGLRRPGSQLLKNCFNGGKYRELIQKIDIMRSIWKIYFEAPVGYICGFNTNIAKWMFRRVKK